MEATWCCVYCVCRALESWRWREAWSNPWSEESSRTAGQTHSHLLFLSSIFILSAVLWLVLLLSLPFSWCYFVLSGLRTFQQTEQSWPCQPASSSETTVSIYMSFSFPLTVLVKRSITGNYWTLLVVFTMHWTDSVDKTAWLTVACSKYLIADIW